MIALNAEHHDMITLESLQVQCIVGIHPHERIAPQPLEVQVKLYLHRRPGQFGERLEESVDYGYVLGDVAFLLENAQFKLLETAAEAICGMVLGPQAPDRPAARPAAMEVLIRKPLALGGLAIPSVCITRRPEELAVGLERNGFGEVDILHESEDCGVYRLRIAPRSGIPKHYHEQMGEAELVMSDGLLLQGNPVWAGLGHVWPKGFVHAYDNPTDVERSILCINRPAFIPSDEIPAAADAPMLPVVDCRKRYFGLPLATDFNTNRP